MSRYPYTDAYDALRSIPEKGDYGIECKLSRSECAQIVSFIASAMGYPAEAVVTKIADYAKQQEVAQ